MFFQGDCSVTRSWFDVSDTMICLTDINHQCCSNWFAVVLYRIAILRARLHHFINEWCCIFCWPSVRSAMAASHFAHLQGMDVCVAFSVCTVNVAEYDDYLVLYLIPDYFVNYFSTTL